MIEDLLTQHIFEWFFIFCRIGTALMLVPGIGDNFVSTKIRLVLALGLSVILFPVVQRYLPTVPHNVFILLFLVLKEVMIGAFLGMIVRIFLSALDVAGTLISFQIGFSNAAMFNPALSAQGSLASVFYTIIGTTLIYITDLHHLFIRGLVESYMYLSPLETVSLHDLSDTMLKYISDAFIVGVKMSLPFLILSVLFSVSLGILSRLMPQLQVFFIAMPIQLLVGIILVAATVMTMLIYWLNYTAQGLGGLFGLN